MVNIVDSTQDVTITLITEGVGMIVSFTATPTVAKPGDPITFSFSLKNDGDTADTLFGRIVDADTGAVVISEVTWPTVAVGETVSVTPAAQTMPNKHWNLRLEAGHVE